LWCGRAGDGLPGPHGPGSRPPCGASWAWTPHPRVGDRQRQAYREHAAPLGEVGGLLEAGSVHPGRSAYHHLLAIAQTGRSPAEVASFDPTAIGLAGVQLAQIAAGVLGVLLVTSEYATGMIRTSMVAVPRRLPVLWGKAIVLALTAPLLFVPATFATFLVSQSVLSREQLGTSLHQPGVARAVLGSALYLTAVGLLRLGLGALLRNTAGAIASLFGVLFGLQIVVGFLPASPSPTCGPTRPRSHPGPGSACSACTRSSCSGWRPGCCAAATSDPAAGPASGTARLVAWGTGVPTASKPSAS
jgi:hypothetical protein